MGTPRQRPAQDDGESLIELTMAIMIMGIIVVAIGACIAFTVKASGIHRSQAVADQYLHNYAEQLQGSYKKCSDAGSTSALQSYYRGLLTAPGGSFPSVGVPAVAFWNDSAPVHFAPSPTCPVENGLQQLTLNLTSGDGHVSESLVVVIRNAS